MDTTCIFTVQEVKRIDEYIFYLGQTDMQRWRQAYICIVCTHVIKEEFGKQQQIRVD